MADRVVVLAVDSLVETLYREAGESSAEPPGMGVFLERYLGRSFCVHCHAHKGMLLRLGRIEQTANDCDVHLPVPKTLDRLPALGYAIALVLACDVLSRCTGHVYSDVLPCRGGGLGIEECGLADAIVLPTPAVRSWSDRSIGDTAAELVTTVALVKRRRLAASGVRGPSLVRAHVRDLSPMGQVIDLAARRRLLHQGGM